MRPEGGTGMLIGKSRVLFLIVIFFAGCKTTQTEKLSQKPNEGWWVSETFTPSETNIKGIPVTQIRPDWERVLLVNEEYLKERLSESQFRDIQQSILKFDLQVNLDDTPNEEKIVVGVYEASSGEKGRFMAIYRDYDLIKLFTDAESSGYSSIFLEENRILWYKCMECGNFDSILWSGSDYFMK